MAWLKKQKRQIKCEDKGGLAFPNIIYYNWTCHSRIIKGFIAIFKGGPEPLEAWECAPLLIGELTSVKRPRSRARDNPILTNSIRVRREIINFTSRKNTSSYLTPLINNRNLLQPGINSAIFRSWHDRGIRVIGDLFDDNDVLTVLWNGLNWSEQDPSWATWGIYYPLHKKQGFISHIYDNFLSNNEQNIDKVVERWEKGRREECIRASRSLFLWYRFKEKQYRILHRQHSRSPLFTKSKVSDGTYMHCFWDCSKIALYKQYICKDPGQILLEHSKQES